MTLLEVRELTAGYGGSTVLNGVDLTVEDGDSVAVLGRNGVGKTTFVHTLMGLVKPASGSVRLRGRELAGRRTDVIARAGASLCPQGRRIFGPLTVKETIDLAASLCRRPGPWDAERVLDVFPRLRERLDQRSSSLSGGEQQMLAIARALLCNPVLLLLDEPSDGLAPAIVRQIEQVLVEVRDSGVGLVLVEQDLHLAFSATERVCVMEKGRFVHAASTPAFRRDRPTARRLLGVG